MKNFKQLQNVTTLDKKAQQNVKGGWLDRSCPRPGMWWCEPGRCVPRGWQCP
ncbi:hypothetical protein [Microscilla marina]|nr:hypothetical protein [Microscilla marina]